MSVTRYRLAHCLVLATLAGSLLLGCGHQRPTLEATPPASATVVLSPSAGAGPTYTNPVYAQDFPDPHILRVGDTYYGYATNTAGANIRLIRSADLATWVALGDALPILPSWAAASGTLTWAPSVIQIQDRFVLYYTTRHAESGRQCISCALSDTPEGPFVDHSTAPLVCQVELGGSIDPYAFADADGRLYLLWKNDGNCCGHKVSLWAQPLAADGLSLTGSPVELIACDQAWERPLIENPAMVRDGDSYYLFYSGNWWESHEYAIGYAVCETVTGPCVKPLDKPLLHYEGEVMGPGGASFFTDAHGHLWMAYHAWTGADVGYPAGQRSLRIDPVTFADGRPIIDGPSQEPRPLR